MSFMLDVEKEYELTRDDHLRTPSSRESDRQEIAALTKNFLDNGGEIVHLEPGETKHGCRSWVRTFFSHEL